MTGVRVSTKHLSVVSYVLRSWFFPPLPFEEKENPLYSNDFLTFPLVRATSQFLSVTEHHSPCCLELATKPGARNQPSSELYLQGCGTDSQSLSYQIPWGGGVNYIKSPTPSQINTEWFRKIHAFIHSILFHSGDQTQGLWHIKHTFLLLGYTLST